jgi:exodeoxyribonuclease-3
MLLATWNVNSIRARDERVRAWLAERKPDVVCLQELKVEDEKFPLAEYQALGWHVALHGQRTYNGVAILSRMPLEDVQRGLQDGEDDLQARLISATVGGVRVLSVYAPNGESIGSEKYQYKLRWFSRLRRHLDARHPPQTPLALCGDLNVAPEPRDVHDPHRWEPTVLYHPDARAALQQLIGFGLTDAFRLRRDEPGLYSWWDYRAGAFHKNQGLRIDHLLVTAPLIERVVSAEIDRNARKGPLPSDHAPVLIELRDA